MPRVPLTATKDFHYMTRRLTAGDSFEARNALEAKILTRVRKVAEVPTAKPKAAPAPKAEAPAPVTAKNPAPAVKKAPAKRKAKARK